MRPAHTPDPPATPLAPCQGIAGPVAPGTAATGYREGEERGAGYTETRVGTAEVPVVQQVGWGGRVEWRAGWSNGEWQVRGQ